MTVEDLEIDEHVIAERISTLAELEPYVLVVITADPSAGVEEGAGAAFARGRRGAGERFGGPRGAGDGVGVRVFDDVALAVAVRRYRYDYRADPWACILHDTLLRRLGGRIDNERSNHRQRVPSDEEPQLQPSSV
jgi:hypothetical protein